MTVDRDDLKAIHAVIDGAAAGCLVGWFVGL